MCELGACMKNSLDTSPEPNCLHNDPLAEEVYRLSPPAVRGRIDTLKEKIAEGRADAEECRAELSEIITADCPKCGSLLVDVVGRPFTGGMEFPI